MATFAGNKAAKKTLSSQKTESLLSQSNGVSIGTLINTSDMTITESYQSETQSTADIGASFDIAQINKDLSETIENDEALWSQTNEEESTIRSRIFTPLNVILTTMAGLLVLGLTLIRERTKRS